METEQSKNELITRFVYKIFSEIDNGVEKDEKQTKNIAVG